ncbi:hypothetical protein FHT85_003261 [Rhizobium sp. BK312]|nr:hypothetical protein [Rhizobium sp. BK312]MBB3426273.1 hypothetical protein [Rhizobium sp. BK312]
MQRRTLLKLAAALSAIGIARAPARQVRPILFHPQQGAHHHG